MEFGVTPDGLTLHIEDEVLVCSRDATIPLGTQRGYIVKDTRLVSGYRVLLGDSAPVLLQGASAGPFSARFEFTNPTLVTAWGQIEECSLHLRIDRTLGGGVHEDYEVTNYSRSDVELDLEVHIECDFADLFDLRGHVVGRRGIMQSTWDEQEALLVTTYRNEQFVRALEVAVERCDSPAEFANGSLIFRLQLSPGASWHTCLKWQPRLPERRRPTSLCHALVDGTEAHRVAIEDWVAHVTRIRTSDPTLDLTIARSVEDLSSLRMAPALELGADPLASNDQDSWVPAGGVPWFVTLFGRDALIVSLQTLMLSPQFALATLRALAALQGTTTDDERDLQPGKIEHEIRHGELAQLGLIPHTPYYGTHDATTLYVLTAAEAWRWKGECGALESVRPNVERALEWIDRDGDSDGDGLQEYATRSRHGYYNQGWKDAEDAVLDSKGVKAPLPIALCEHQGYVVAAKRAWAEVLESAFADDRGARRLRHEADRLAEMIEERFWWQAEGTYYLGLDGNKRPIETVASNPAHLLWSRAVDEGRARQVARRLLEPDMFSGWGIRTLASSHKAFNPFAYHLGTVWPHDNAIAAAGFRHYGLDVEAVRVAEGIFDAAQRFAGHRLPELFAGLARDEGGFPVPYLGANVPQAWASGAVVHLVTTLLGLDVDARKAKVSLDPFLPEWLEEIHLENLRVGEASVDLRVRRGLGGEHELDLDERVGRLDVKLKGASWPVPESIGLQP
jgi:glycogen debranching enzyme